MTEGTTPTLEEFLAARVDEGPSLAEVLARLPFRFNPEGLQEHTRRVLAGSYASHPDYRQEWKP